MPKGSKRNERETRRVKGNSKENKRYKENSKGNKRYKGNSKGNERYQGKRKRNKIYNENERETNGAKMPMAVRAAAQATGEWLQAKHSAASS